MAKRDNERAAEILVDAAYMGDSKAAEKWGVTTRTVQNYRAALEEDPELSSFFARKRQVNEQAWVSELAKALKASARKLGQWADAIENPSMEEVREIRHVFKDLSEVAITREVLRAGDGQQDTEGAGQG